MSNTQPNPDNPEARIAALEARMDALFVEFTALNQALAEINQTFAQRVLRVIRTTKRRAL